MSELLPEELCAAVCFCGSHQDASAHYKKLMDFITANRLRVTGFSKEVTIVDFGLTNDPEQFVTEIQIPVSADR